MKYLVGIVQTSSQDNFKENLAFMEHSVDEAASRGCRLVSFPETVNFIGDRTAPGGAPPETEDGPTARLLSSLALKHGLYIHGGSWAEKNEGDTRSFNTTLMFGPDGAILAKYRKLHTFDITLPDGTQARESDRIRGGDAIVTAKTALGTFGFTICYDLRFPELFRLLTLDGADVIFTPAHFTLQTGKDHWEALLRARAIENSCYIVAAGQTGRTPRMLAYGNSMVVDPWGTVIARAGEKPGLSVAEIDLDYLGEVRQRMQTIENRRRDVYSLRQGKE